MSGLYDHLTQQVGAFVVVCITSHLNVLIIDGLFLSFGEFGPGDNIGLIAAKVPATAIRGQFYGIAAAVGKIGAFSGAYAFEDVLPLPIFVADDRLSTDSADRRHQGETLARFSWDRDLRS